MLQIVVDLQSRLTGLLVRMTAVEALLGQQPLLTGRYTAAPYHFIAQVRPAVVHITGPVPTVLGDDVGILDLLTRVHLGRHTALAAGEPQPLQQR